MMLRLLPLALLLAWLAAAPEARAEEVFVLAKGAVVRGTAVREVEDRIVVRLTGLAEENTITLHRSEIKRRFLLSDPAPRTRDTPSDADAPLGGVPLAGTPGVPRTLLLAADGSVRVGGGPDVDENGLPVEPPALHAEGFFERLARVTRVALPDALEGRLLVGLLLIVVLATFVAGGTRLLGMKAASLQAYTTLGILLGVFLLADILWHQELLRADRALWVIPVQGLLWLGVARSSLEAPLHRAIPLLAMVLFAATCFVFATGSLLVSV